MRALRNHRCFGSLSRWLAVIALLMPLLLPALPGAAGTIIAQATVSADVFTAELCSINHVVDDRGELPVDHHDQHCPLCVSIQHLGSCLKVDAPAASVAMDFVADISLSPPLIALPSDVHLPGQPRAPPIRV
jgi:hypothetical protein